MTKTNDDQKRKAIAQMSKPGRQIHVIAKMKRGNSSPDFNRESLLERSKATSQARAKRHSAALRAMSAAD